MISIDRAQGCLIGLAVGDVLGCPAEAMSPGYRLGIRSRWLSTQTRRESSALSVPGGRQAVSRGEKTIYER